MISEHYIRFCLEFSKENKNPNFPNKLTDVLDSSNQEG